jgi:hypothetical protein
MTFESIRCFFGVRPTIIQAQIELAKDSVSAPGSPALLSAATKEWFENPICARFEERKPIIYAEVLDALQYDHQGLFTADTLRHVIRDMESAKTIIGQLMEADRNAVDPDEISAWFERLNFMVYAVPHEFFFNMDETGCSGYSDGREVRAIVPIDFGEPSIPVPFDRHSKCSTIMAYIAVDGFRMKPFAILDRITAEKELQYHGYDASNVTLTSQANAFLRTALFELWTTTVFLPTIEQRLLDLAYDGRVVLLIDGLGSHHTDRFLADCKTRQIDVLFLIPHASHQIQPLDLLTLGLMKQGFSASNVNGLSNPQSNKVVCMLGAWFGASAPHHNVKTFMNVGLIPYERDDRFFLRVVPEKARRVHGSDIFEGSVKPDFPPGARRPFRLPTGV